MLLGVGDSGAQTASVLAFPGMARMLQLREEEYGQEATEDSELISGNQARGQGSQQPSNEHEPHPLALPPHVPQHFHPAPLYPALPLCQAPAHAIRCLSQNPAPETMNDKLSYTLGPPCSFRT